MNNSKKSPLTYLCYIIGGIFIILGVVVAVMVNSASEKRENLKTDFTETQGIVDEIIDETGTNFDTVIKYVLVHYEVNGKVYDNVRIDEFPATVQKGDSITVYYDPDNPKTIIKTPAKRSIFAANFISLVLVALGFAALFIAGKFSPKTRSETDFESRYKPYDYYTEETTERAGTLFDHEVDPSELVLEDDKSILKHKKSHKNIF